MPKPPPDLEAVRNAVANYFADDARSGPARAALIEWGDSALPLLERLAREPHDSRLDQAIVCALLSLRAQEALDFFVEIIAGTTQTAAESALVQMRGLLRRGGWALPHLAANPEFKRVMLGFASSTTLHRSALVEAASALGWLDAIPLLRHMLKDADYSIRKRAAKGLGVLTREPVHAERPVASFPARALRSELLRRPRALENTARGSASYGAVAVDEPGGSAWKVVLTNTRGPTLRARARTPRAREDWATVAMCLDANGDVAWSYGSAEIRGIVALRAESEIYGVALACGGPGSLLVALDTSGEILWEVRMGSHEVRSHPELPGLLGFVGGRVTLYEHDRSGARERDLEPFAMGSFPYAVDGLLFPAEDGQASWIVAGRDAAEPSLVRYDTQVERRWEAVLPDHPAGVALLEPSNGARAIAAVTRCGELFVLDVRGALLWEGVLSGSDGADETRVTGIEARELGDECSVVVHAIHGSFAYDVDVNAL